MQWGGEMPLEWKLYGAQESPLKERLGIIWTRSEWANEQMCQGLPGTSNDSKHESFIKHTQINHFLLKVLVSFSYWLVNYWSCVVYNSFKSFIYLLLILIMIITILGYLDKWWNDEIKLSYFVFFHVSEHAHTSPLICTDLHFLSLLSFPTPTSTRGNLIGICTSKCQHVGINHCL